MLIADIFYSIQGEGELAGIPSAFVRTSGCNLRCSWCDTKYASWNPEGEELGIEAIVQKVTGFPTRHCVITGGEPMLAKGIVALSAELKKAGFHITIETAGTILPGRVVCDLASLSPKLSNSTPVLGSINETWRRHHEDRRFQPLVLREWIEKYAFQLKFVVETTEDNAEINEVLAAIARPIPPSKVLLMPEGTDLKKIRGRDETLIDLCLKFGYRYCNRLHIDLFGNKRAT